MAMPSATICFQICLEFARKQLPFRGSLTELLAGAMLQRNDDPNTPSIQELSLFMWVPVVLRCRTVGGSEEGREFIHHDRNHIQCSPLLNTHIVGRPRN